MSGDVSEAVRVGRVEGLVALRDRLALEIDSNPEPRDLAALSTRLEKVLEQIDGLKESDGGDLDDELERRRLEKQGGLAGAEAAGS